MKRLTDAEYIEVLPQFLGISFALALYATLTGNHSVLYIALGVLFLLILRASPLLFVGRLIHGTLKTIGGTLVNIVLGVMYLTLISLYAVLFRVLSKESVEKFKPAKSTTSTYTIVSKKYNTADFEKTW